MNNRPTGKAVVFALTAAVLLSPVAASAAEEKPAIELGAIFADNAILQQQMKIPVWGASTPGAKIRVEFAGQKKTVAAGKDGRWMLKLDALKASASPREMVVTESTGKKLTLKNILVGEVWLASGQSNMSYCIKRFGNCAKDIPNAKYPKIRHFMVSRIDSTKPQKDAIGAWAVCSPETVARFTATGYYFALELHKKLGVPIGIINSSVGGTTVEQWSDLATLEANPDNDVCVKKRKTAIEAETPELLEAYRKSVKDYLSLVGVNPSVIIDGTEDAFLKPDLSEAAWTPTKLPHSCGSGVTWFAREVQLPRNMIGKDITLKLGTVNKEEITYWNGIRIGAQAFYGRGSVHKIPAILAKEAKNVLSVRCTGYRGGGISGGQSLSGGDGESISLAGDGWKYRTYARKPSYPKALVKGSGSGLYNGMIHPLIPYTIRGIIWYQGENNTGKPYPYRKQFPEMIRGWRKNWGQGDFPFYFCQLANYHPKQSAIETNHGWPLLREAQAMALSLPNTGMACLIDIGKLGTYERDIHPANNQDQGKRLALIARDKIYGEKLVSSGPMYDSMTVKGDRIIVKFKSVGSGLLRAGIRGWYDHTIIPLPTHPRGLAIHGFTIAGADGDFRMAHARITGKDTVEVWHDKVPEPKHVRFAWHRNPLHNLYNMEKLPAPPFRTDSIKLK